MTELLAAVASPVLDPESRTFAPWLLLAALVAGGHHLWRNRHRPAAARATLLHAVVAPRLWRHRSAVVDLQLLLARRALSFGLAGAELGLGWLVATSLVRGLDRGVGIPAIPAPPALALTVAYSAVLFVAGDLSRWLVHRAMHAVPALWELHQVHHSAEVLTPLTYHRVHPLEAALFSARGALVTGLVGGLAFWAFRGEAVQWTVLGVAGFELGLNAVFGNLRHSHVWVRFGRWERWWLSPAQHQLHHALGHDHANYGTWLAVWDRWAGSWVEAPERPPRAYGLAQANHQLDDLRSVLLDPLRGVVRQLLRPVWALLAVGRTAAGQEPAADEGEDYETIVVSDEGVPRVAGSAHVVTEEELERYEHADIHKVLARVPGVYVRGEDGFGLRPNIGMRGANSDRSSKVTLLEDGLPLSPAPYAAPAAYYFPLTNRLVGVEVFKGPAALEHGPQTIGGAVNLKTRAVPTEPAGALDVAVGIRRFTRLHGWIGAGTARGGVLAEVAHVSSGGFKELPDGGPTGFERQDAMFAARRTFGAHTLGVKLGWGRERSNETYLGLTLADLLADPDRRYAASQDDLMRWQRTQAEGTWRWTVARAVEVRTAAWYHGLDRVWTKVNGFVGVPDLHGLLQSGGGGQSAVYLAVLDGQQDSANEDQQILLGTNDRTFHSGGAQTLARVRVGGESVRSETRLGMRLMADDVVRVHTEDPYAMVAGELVAAGGPTVTTLDSHNRAVALAGWAHEDLDLGRLQVLPGARVEWIRTTSGTTATGPEDPVDAAILLPGIGLLTDPVDGLALFGGVHRGFSPVAPGQGPDVEPETAINLEAGARASPGQTRAELVAFWSEYQNIVGQCTLSGGCTDDQLDTQFNGGQARVTGLEALLSQVFLLPAHLSVQVDLSWTYTHGAFLTGFVSAFPQYGAVEAGDELPYVPEHQGGGQIVLSHPRASLALSASGRGPMRDVAGQDPIADTDVPGQLLLDVAATYDLSERVSAYVTATNLTDSRVLDSWRPYGARPVAPLQVSGGVKAGF